MAPCCGCIVGVDVSAVRSRNVALYGKGMADALFIWLEAWFVWESTQVEYNYWCCINSPSFAHALRSLRRHRTVIDRATSFMYKLTSRIHLRT